MKTNVFKKAAFAVIVTMLLVSNAVHGQEQPSIVKHEIYPHWYYFEKEEGVPVLTVKDFVPICKAEFGLSESDDLDVKDVTFLDELAIEKSADSRTRCIKYQQYYNGYEVESSVIVTFDMSDTITVVTGNLVGNLNIDTSEPISQSAALNVALGAVTGTFIWQDSILMDGYCMDEDGNFDSLCYNRFLPKGKLCLARKFGDDFTSNNICFVWKFIVNTTTAEYRVLVNAKTGEIYDVAEVTKEGQYAKGNVQTLHDGYITNEMETFKCSLCFRWKLQNSNGNKTVLNRRKVKSRTNEWTDSSEAPATTAHWIIGQLADFYRIKYLNYTISEDTYINAGIPNFENARYLDGNSIEIGEMNNHWLSTIDIIGHELAHRLVDLSANLEYQGESGALNESFADIFGTLAERFIRTNHGRNWNWTLGEDAVTLRSMSDPHLYSQPDHYQGLYWVNPQSAYDNGGVHINSGVQNKWFYNLSQTIGPDKAGLVAYYMLHLYLTPTSNYYDALFASVFAAENLFGRCSDERSKVISAWSSVGISSANIPLCASSQQEAERFSVDEIYDNNMLLYMEVYPNPASRVVNIEFSDELDEGIIEIYNSTGIKVDEILARNKTVSIGIDHLPNGLYLINAVVNGKSVNNAKVLINN